MIEDLMVHAVTLRKRDGENRNSVGGSTPTFDELETMMYLEPINLGSFEYKENRNTPVGSWLGIGLATDPWDSSWDQVVYGEIVFDIDAPPRPIPNPRTQTLHHYEIDLREVR